MEPKGPLFPKMEKVRKPIEDRITYEIDGEKRRLRWIAENKPEFLIYRIGSPEGDNFSAILSALTKVGYDRFKIEKEAEEHPEWKINLGTLRARLGIG